jgi:hypothetical protein
MFTATVYILWGIAWLGTVFLGTLIFRKDLHREYPIFFAFLIAGIVTDLLNFVALLLSYRMYYFTYWTGSAVMAFLGFAVLHEIFRHIFRPFEDLRSFGSALFRWSTLVLLMIGAIMAISAAPVTKSPVTSFIFTIDRSVCLMQCGLVFFICLFARQLGLGEGHRVFGISVGFGVTASIHLVAVAVRWKFPSAISGQVLNTTYMVASIISITIWFIYMYRPEPERRRASVLEQSENWNYALAAATQGDSASAFLPSVVDTVDRVLNKRSVSISSEFKLRG